MLVYLVPFFVFAVAATGQQLKLYRAWRWPYALSLLLIALFAGLRFQTGQDWEPYEAFFDRLDLTADPIELYYGDERPPFFEIGYYLLNYAVKWLGGSYSTIFLGASLFSAWTVYRLTARFAMNRFYFLAIYFSYSFMLLHFAQVRQSIAIGFFLLGCDYYLRHGRKVPALLIAMIGTAFQFTSLMYIILLPLVFWWPKLNRMQWLAVGLTAVGGALALAVAVDMYALLAAISGSATSEEKVAIYKETQTEQGSGQRIYAVYLVLVAWYFARQLRTLRPQALFITKYAIAALLLTALMTGLFPGSYVMYSRAYVAACIFQGFAGALIFNRRKGLLHRTMFAVTLVVSALMFVRLIALYSDEYLPYKMVLFTP